MAGYSGRDFGKIIVIGHAEGFLAGGLISKLDQTGIAAEAVGTDIKRIEALKDEAELYIAFADEGVEDESECLVFLKDVASDTDRRIIVIGNAESIEHVKKTIPKTLILREFLRPLEMEELLKTIKHYLDTEAGENRKKSILIVDDDITYMRLIYEWLSPYYHVGMVASGIQAIKYLAKNKVDLVLLDYEMPVTNGPKVLEMLRSESDSGSIPVMFLTGKNDRDSVMSVLDLKPVDYLLKTIDKKSLKAKLDTFFEK